MIHMHGDDLEISELKLVSRPEGDEGEFGTWGHALLNGPSMLVMSGKPVLGLPGRGDLP
jgi:hypothetical protein